MRARGEESAKPRCCVATVTRMSEAMAKKAGATPPTKRRGRAILVPAVICRTAARLQAPACKLCTVPTRYVARNRASKPASGYRFIHKR